MFLGLLHPLPEIEGSKVLTLQKQKTKKEYKKN